MSIISGMNDSNLKVVVPPQGTPVINVNGVLFPVGVGGGINTSDATAQPSDVFAGQVFYNADGKQEGTMPEASLNDPQVSFDNNNDTLTVVVSSTEGRIVSETSEKTKLFNISEVVPLENGGYTVTPGTKNSTISGGKFIANDIIIKGDSNLISANIVEGKSIFGVAGSFKATQGSQTPSGDGFSKAKVFCATLIYR
jgi:hypothetical protein